MKVLITGANGTVGKAMCDFLDSRNYEYIKWERELCSPWDFDIMEDYMRNISPDLVFHFAIASNSISIENETWLVNVKWSSKIAEICKRNSIKFLMTSSVMVYSDNAIGPFTCESIPDASSGYGLEKLEAEKAVFSVNDKAYCVRLGWQISDDLTRNGNSMVHYLENEFEKNGIIKASSRWYPSCSFVTETVKELHRIVKECEPDLYLLNSNHSMNYYEITKLLKNYYGKKWKIVESCEFIFDQRMKDSRVLVEKLEERIGFETVVDDWYCVFELPEIWKKRVMKYRMEFEDRVRLNFPVEITVTGSSGVGCMVQGQKNEIILEEIKGILSEISRFSISFESVEKFDGTDTYFLKLKDESILRSIHQKLIESKIQFYPSNFKYTPHCTIISKYISDAKNRILIDDNEKFEVTEFSIYMMKPNKVKKIFSYILGQ